jgi:hypothetical protein
MVGFMVYSHIHLSFLCPPISQAGEGPTSKHKDVYPNGFPLYFLTTVALALWAVRMGSGLPQGPASLFH